MSRKMPAKPDRLTGLSTLVPFPEKRSSFDILTVTNHPGAQGEDESPSTGMDRLVVVHFQSR